MSEIISIIIPTWNNPQYLQGCISSILSHGGAENLFHVYVINNGHKDSCKWIGDNPYVTVIYADGNKGWEGGLKLGLEASTSPYVMFLNDDTYIPISSSHWISKLLQHFRDEKVGAVGPSSNVVLGFQNIFVPLPVQTFTTRFLIGFCVLFRRSTLMEIGGVDDTLPGGDDFDYSIRLRDKGYKLIADRNVFVYHHGFKTGERVFGTSDKTGGWNSYEFREKTDFALIAKHGFRKWYETAMLGIFDVPKVEYAKSWEDKEQKIVKSYIKGKKILDLGCGSNKTVPHAIGVDMIKGDEQIDTLQTKPKSVADVQADVSQPLPFKNVDTIIARHILEHMVDPIKTVYNWHNILKKKGRVIIAVPLEGLINSIPMNVEHLHAWTPEAMQNLLHIVGFKVLDQKYSENGVSFVTVAEK